MKRILVAEDESSIREFIVINLKYNGFEVVDVPDGASALEEYHASSGNFDITLLDIMMPGVDGLEVCKKIRQENTNIGIIMLTAKTQEMDKVSCLLMGADDYVTKPFSLSELLARIDAVYRRVALNSNNDEKAENENCLISNDYILDLRNHSLTQKGRLIELTQVEFQIMEYFFLNQGVALSRTDILNKVWGCDRIGEEKIVDVNIRRLRMKIEKEPSSPKHLVTIWGVGYKWIS
ncbi:MAG: response regulator transcription factor [Clostridiales bacterium]|nr:response regulator transcription factor [Clostridiales bacterium]